MGLSEVFFENCNFEGRSEYYSRYCDIKLAQGTYSKRFIISLLLKMWKKEFFVYCFTLKQNKCHHQQMRKCYGS